MKVGTTLYVINRKDWRVWLEKHHTSEKEIWLISYRKNSGKQTIPYETAVEEALCFGWIDSIEKGIDHERFAQRFTPRKPKSNWSDSNKERVKRLIKKGKMTEAGFAKLLPQKEASHEKIKAEIEKLFKDLEKRKKAAEDFSKKLPKDASYKLAKIVLSYK
jgi:uncharacterized protein YdeI (YjbR/CyaY-like superfamily)